MITKKVLMLIAAVLAACWQTFAWQFCSPIGCPGISVETYWIIDDGTYSLFDYSGLQNDCKTYTALPNHVVGIFWIVHTPQVFRSQDFLASQYPSGTQFLWNCVINTTYPGALPGVQDAEDNRKCPIGTCPGCGNGAMPTWRVSEPYITLWLEDNPLGYKPAMGPPISLDIQFKQHETQLGLDTNMFGLGSKWSCSWLSYIDQDPHGNYEVRLGSGGTHNLTNGVDYLTNARLSGNSTSGFTISHPDGSAEAYNFIVTNSSGSFLKAFLTDQKNPFSQGIHFNYANYTSSAPVIRLISVVDANGLSTVISYVTNNPYSTNLITQVTDPFGRFATFLYDNSGHLTNVTDVMGISSSFIYDNFQQVTNLTTPYGATGFRITENRDSTGTTLVPDGRAIEVTEPDGAKQLYLFTNSAPGIPASYPSVQVASVLPFTNANLNNSSMNVNNSFHWNKLQYSKLSTNYTLSGNLGQLTTNDFILADMKHWLRAGSYTVSEVLSMERSASPDGSAEGQKEWYDYAGKTNAEYVGTQVLPLFAAHVLPDGSTHFIRTDRNSLGLPTTEITTYSVGGSIALRTNIFTYAPNGIDLITVTNALNIQVTSNAYNGYHQITNNFNALGELATLTYNANQQLSSITSPSGLITTNVYSTSGAGSNRIASTTDYANVSGSVVYYRTNSFTWANGLVATHTDPLGLTVANTWDNLQRLRRVDFPDGTFITNIFTNLDLIRVVDRMGYSNSFGYNAVRQMVASTNANGMVTRYGYCSCGSLTAVTNAFGTSLQNATTFFWDLQGHMLQSVGPEPYYAVSYNYNSLGQLTNVYDGLTSVIYWYNNQGLLVTSSNAYGQVSAAIYDILDRATNTVDANSVSITNAFDNLGRLLTRGYPDGGVERYLYTPNVVGPTSYTNQLGTNMVNSTYDPLGRKTMEVYPGITTNNFTYNGIDHLLTLTDGKNQTTSWTYDLYGRTATKTDATSTIILTNAYDPDNRLTNRWSIAKGNTTYSYDGVGNLTGVQYPVSHGINYYYDLLNRLTNMVDGVGSSYYGYTVAGQLASEDGPWVDDTVSFSYSSATRLRTGLSLLQPNTSPWVQSYGYDSAERLQSLTSPAGSFGYGYDPVRQTMVNSLSLPNAAYITNSFDSVARLLGTVLKNSTNGVLNSHSYAYNLAGQRTYLTNTAGDYRNYLYDNVGELTNVFAHEANGAGRVNEYLSYTYDPSGNLKTRYIFSTTEAFNVNNLNELTTQSRSGSTFTVAGTTTSAATNVLLTPNGGWPFSVTPYADNTWGVGAGLNNGTNTFVAVAQDALGRSDTNTVTCYLPVTNSFAYDGNGNLLSDGNRNFAYDDENQLTSVWVTNGWRSDFVYDGKMRRRIRREYTWFASGWLQTNEVRYIYDGSLVIQERDANNLPTLSYTRGRDLSGSLQGEGGIGGLLAMSQGTGLFPQHSFYHADGNGSVTALINANQAIVARYLYDPFGNVLSKAGPLADVNVYRFSSKEWHRNSGSIYFLYRFSDPNLQRWLNRDPLGEGGSLNLYAYVGNNPINQVDALGLWGIQFGNVNIGWGNPNYAFDSSSWYDIANGAAATVDGLLPQPYLEDLYKYGDPFDDNNASYSSDYNNALDVANSIGWAIAAPLKGDKPKGKDCPLLNASGHQPMIGGLKQISQSQTKRFDIHLFKEDVVGEHGRSFNVSVDEDDGSVWLTPVKKGSGENVNTGWKSIWDVIEEFPIKPIE